jgi:putative transposase
VLAGFDESKSGRKYPAIAQSWRRNWEAVSPSFAFATDVRKVIYTTNTIESLIAWHAAEAQLAIRFEDRFVLN